jgi:translation initiation factor 3 subunit E
MLDAFLKLSKYYFECGDYQTSRDHLEAYISLLAKPPPVTEEEEDVLNPNVPATATSIGNPQIYYLENVTSTTLTVLWGKLAAEILVEDWDASRVALEAVQHGLESLVTSRELTALEALQQRTWLLHWSLFVYWNAKQGGLETLVDLFFSERYKQAMTTNAPHLLRYLTAAVLLCKRRIAKKASLETRRLLKNLTSAMADCDYTDPVVEFVHNLCVVFDFEQAQIKLAECEHVLQADFFLCKQTALFMEEARVFVFENYCRIHNKIDLKTLSDKLAMDQEAAERWIVDLIRNADFQAKIDSSRQCVVMGTDAQSIYEQVMERTKDLNVRSATLAQSLHQILQERNLEASRKERAAREEY